MIGLKNLAQKDKTKPRKIKNKPAELKVKKTRKHL